MEGPRPAPGTQGEMLEDATRVDIRTEFSQLLVDVETEMRRLIEGRPDRVRPLYEMLAYHLGIDAVDGPRGKRLRPLLGLLAYQSLAGDYRPALPGAAAVELGHNFSLVHDDIEDADRERRHRPTLWAIWGVPLAINAGDALIAVSRLALYRLLEDGFSETKVLRLMRIYDETCLALCEGQYLDISFERRLDVSVEEYIDMIGKKTAALIGASVQAGAMLATDDPAIVEPFRRFGYHLGLAFQVADDLKGAFGTNAETGKPVAGDVARRKKTLPVVWALEHAPTDDAARLRELYGPREPGGDLDPAAVEEALAIMERSGARAETLATARRYRDLALADVGALNLPADRAEPLRQLVASVIAV